MPWCHLAENGDPATAVSALAHFGYGGPSLLYPLLVTEGLRQALLACLGGFLACCSRVHSAAPSGTGFHCTRLADPRGDAPTSPVHGTLRRYVAVVSVMLARAARLCQTEFRRT